MGAKSSSLPCPQAATATSQWASTTGTLAVSRICSIWVTCELPHHGWHNDKILIRTKGSGPLVVFGNADNWGVENTSEMNNLVMAILQPCGTVELATETLQPMLTALQLFRCACDARLSREKWEKLLKQLTSKVGQRGHCRW